MSKILDGVIKRLSSYEAQLREFREVILANAVLIGEIPSPTFGEKPRIDFLNNRFTECGLDNAVEDEAGNGLATINGTKGESNILILAHADTVFTSAVDHAMSVGPDFITGPGIADNSLGLAVIASLPTLFEKLGITFASNIILIGASRSLGHGDLGGLRTFLKNNEQPIDAAICVEGAQIGRLSYSSMGMLRGEIAVEIPEQTDYSKLKANGAISILNKVINRLLAIPLPTEPRTNIILGSVGAGTGFNILPRTGTLRFEVRSQEEGMAKKIGEQLSEYCAEISAEFSVKVKLREIARRKPGGIGYSHPLTRSIRKIMETQGVEPKVAPSTGELSALIAHEIPAITLGITTGENLHEFNEQIAIDPIFSGIAQLIAIIEAVDKGVLNEQ